MVGPPGTFAHIPLLVSCTFIHSPPENDNLWTLKSNLIEFNLTVGRHTGVMIGKDLVKTI